jgi:hypothetical protein
VVLVLVLVVLVVVLVVLVVLVVVLAGQPGEFPGLVRWRGRLR